MKKASISEKARTERTTRGMSRKILPMMPGTKRRGAKAMPVVQTAKVTGRAISIAPAIAASRGLSPCWALA